MSNLEPLLEDKVKAILEKDSKIAKAKGRAPYWQSVMEKLEHIEDADVRNTVFMHTVASMKYALSNVLQEATTSGVITGGPAAYNKAMLPTIIRRVMPSIVASKFVATRQLDVPTQMIQTFRLSRNTAKGTSAVGDELFDPAGNQRYGTYQGNRKGLDPWYSSQEIVGETMSASLSSVTTGTVSANLAKAATSTNGFGGIQIGFTDVNQPTLGVKRPLTIWAISDNNPRLALKIASVTALTGVSTDANGNQYGGVVTAANGLTFGTAPAIAAAGAVSYALDGAGVTTFGTAWNTLTGAALSASNKATIVVDYSVNQERSKNLSELSFKTGSIQVNAKSRKNFAQISVEALQDMEAYTDGKVDALKELISTMTESMAHEIDKELTLAMLANAGKSTSWNAQYAAGVAGQFRGTQADWNQTLVHAMNWLQNDISVDYLRGDDFFGICHPHVYNILQNTQKFKTVGLDHAHQGDVNVGIEKALQGEGFTIAKDPYHPFSDQMLIGYTSKDLTKAPYAYFPYVTYLTPPQADILNGDMFSTIVGLQQRYDHQLMMDGQYGLGKLTVSNLYNNGLYS